MVTKPMSQKKVNNNDNLNLYLNKSSDEILAGYNKDINKLEETDNNNSIMLKNTEILNLKRKIESLEKDKKYISLNETLDNEKINGINYIGDMFYFLYNQAILIDKLVKNDNINRLSENSIFKKKIIGKNI